MINKSQGNNQSGTECAGAILEARLDNAEGYALAVAPTDRSRLSKRVVRRVEAMLQYMMRDVFNSTRAAVFLDKLRALSPIRLVVYVGVDAFRPNAFDADVSYMFLQIHDSKPDCRLFGIRRSSCTMEFSLPKLTALKSEVSVDTTALNHRPCPVCEADPVRTEEVGAGRTECLRCGAVFASSNLC